MENVISALPRQSSCNFGKSRVSPPASITKGSVTDGKLLSTLDDQIAGAVTSQVMAQGYATPVAGARLAIFLGFLAIIGGFSALIWLDSGLLVATLDALESGAVHAVPQSGESSLAPKVEVADARVRWADPARAGHGRTT